MKISQSLAPSNGSTAIQGGFSKVIGSPNYQAMLATAIADPKRRSNFVSSLINAVATIPKLKECSPDSIVAAALPFASYDFPIGLGYAWIIPYGNKAQFQMGAAGYLQLAMRSGQYRSIRTTDVREGEFVGRSSSTGEEIFSFISDDTVRESKPVIGYLASFELINGFKSSVYFPKEKMLKWAARYSKAFSIELFKKYEIYQETGGGMTDSELRACSSPWYERFDAMAEKTVLRQLLKRGILSVELVSAFEAENEGGMAVDTTQEMFNAPAPEPVKEEPPVVQEEPKPAEPVKEESADEEPPIVDPETGEVATEKPVKKHPRKSIKAEDLADDADSLFFGKESF